MPVPIIDADTHVDETEDTWEFMLPNERHLTPTTGYPSNPDPNRPLTRYWIIDGERQPRLTRDDVKTHSTVETRELLDVKARLRDMDEAGAEYHVIYPTTFLIQTTTKPETDLALKRSYNRWLGNRCDESGGRLRWVCLPPVLSSMEETIQELRWAKDHGCVGILKKGDKEAGKWPDNEYFFPMYKEAEALNMPLCFHIGSGTFDRVPSAEQGSSGFLRLNQPVVSAFNTIVSRRMPQQFPKLRYGFIEAGSGWVPFILHGLTRRMRKGREGFPYNPDFQITPQMLEDMNLFVTCLVDEDLSYIMKFTGENMLMVGSDYTHADQSAEKDFAARLGERAVKGDLSERAVDKILYDNAKALYGL